MQNNSFDWKIPLHKVINEQIHAMEEYIENPDIMVKMDGFKEIGTHDWRLLYVDVATKMPKFNNKIAEHILARIQVHSSIKNSKKGAKGGLGSGFEVFYRRHKIQFEQDQYPVNIVPKDLKILINKALETLRNTMTDFNQYRSILNLIWYTLLNASVQIPGMLYMDTPHGPNAKKPNDKFFEHCSDVTDDVWDQMRAFILNSTKVHRDSIYGGDKELHVVIMDPVDFSEEEDEDDFSDDDEQDCGDLSMLEITLMNRNDDLNERESHLTRLKEEIDRKQSELQEAMGKFNESKLKWEAKRDSEAAALREKEKHLNEEWDKFDENVKSFNTAKIENDARYQEIDLQNAKLLLINAAMKERLSSRP